MGYRIQPNETAQYRRPRVERPDHLAAIRQLPCVVCQRIPVEAAHIRTPAIRHGKRPTGTSEKPSDKWTLPLCSHHHREQHSMNELWFYDQNDIDPFVLAMGLWTASGDIPLMTEIVRLARQ